MEAIRTLHGKLDDDANGNIDLSESDEVRKQEFVSLQTFKRQEVISIVKWKIL